MNFTSEKNRAELAAEQRDRQRNANISMAVYNLWQRWGRMSTAQKSLSLANIGVNSFRTPSGKALSDIVLSQSNDPTYRSLTVGGALNATIRGYNAYDLARNWGDLNNAQRVIGGARTAVGIAQTGVETGLLSQAGTIAKAIPIANLGVSALQLYKGWGSSNTEQKAVGATAVAAGGAQVAAQLGSESAASMIPGLNVALAAYTSYQIGKVGYDQYYAHGTRNQKAGYVGAAAGGMAVGGPIGAVGALVVVGAASMINGLSKSGKGKDQKTRDWFRSDWQSRKLADENYVMTLADGSKVDIGLDGKGGMHKVRDASKLLKGHESEIRAYNTDYTNDMDFTAGMAGLTLNRLLYGGRNEHVDAMGSQMGNAFLGSVGYGKDMTQDNFNTVMANARGAYAKAGIDSKEEALKLIGVAAQEGRLTAADQAAALQTVNMMYDDNGYSQAQGLMKGRWTGIVNMNGAAERPPTVNTGTTVNAKPQTVDVETATNLASPRFSKINRYMASKEDIQSRNRLKYGVQSLVA